MTNKELREAANLSQGKLAQRAGVSRSMVAFRERGMQVSPQMEAKIGIALASALDEHSRAVRRARRKVGKAVAMRIVTFPVGAPAA